MKMYAKIFASMYDGTLAENWEALVTFQQLLVLCCPQGSVDVHPRRIASRTGIPLDIIERGLAILSAPDDHSRTPDSGGRRIVLLDEHRDWGWQIVNFEYYRDLANSQDKREKDAARKRESRGIGRARTEADTSGQGRTRADSYTSISTSTSKSKGKGGTGGKGIPPRIEQVQAYWAEKKLAGDPIEFYNHYQANGWVQGKSKPIKDWQAAARGWSGRDPQFKKKESKKYEPNIFGDKS